MFYNCALFYYSEDHHRVFHTDGGNLISIASKDRKVSVSCNSVDNPISRIIIHEFMSFNEFSTLNSNTISDFLNKQNQLFLISCCSIIK